MTMPKQWLLLLYGLPARKSAARVNLWRQLKKSGALPLKTSAYLLPDKPEPKLTLVAARDAARAKE